MEGSDLTIDQQVELHKLATQHLIARDFPKWSVGTVEFEDKYLAFYEKIYNKLLGLTEKYERG
ncbi:MAG: hypothetical protein ACYSWY_10350 [Planctomycetota bacterium]|jgi:hypothetical protein